MWADFGSIRRKSLRKRGLSHDGNRARHFDTGRSCSHHHKGHQRLSPIRIFFDLSLLKDFQQVVPEEFSV
jgi:hypothetical protein